MDIAQELISKIKSGKFDYKKRLDKKTKYKGIEIEVWSIKTTFGGFIGYEVVSLWAKDFSEHIIHLFQPDLTLVRQRFTYDFFKVV